MKKSNKEQIEKIINILRIKKSPDITTILFLSVLIFQIFAFFAYKNGLFPTLP